MTEQSNHTFPVKAGGASIHSLVQHGGGSHLGTYYRIAGPLIIARLLMMGGHAPRKAAAHLMNPSEQADGGGWATHLLDAHKAAVGLEKSFSNDDMEMAFLLAPRGLVITLPGDPCNVAKEVPPKLGLLSHGSARGVKYIVAGIRRISHWRHFLDILGSSPDQIRTKLLTHFGHGGVSFLLADTPHANNVSAEAARVTIRRATGAPALGHRQCGPTTTCHVCDTRGNELESLEQHAVRCPA